MVYAMDPNSSVIKRLWCMNNHQSSATSNLIHSLSIQNLKNPHVLVYISNNPHSISIHSESQHFLRGWWIMTCNSFISVYSGVNLKSIWQSTQLYLASIQGLNICIVYYFQLSSSRYDFTFKSPIHCLYNTRHFPQTLAPFTGWVKLHYHV